MYINMYISIHMMFATFWALPRGIYSRFNLPFFSPTIVVTDASHASCEANWDGFTKMDTMASNPKHELAAYSRWKTHEVRRRSHLFNSVPATQYIICGSNLIVRLWYFSPSQHLRVDHSGAHYHFEVIRCSKAFVHLRIAPAIVANEGMLFFFGIPY